MTISGVSSQNQSVSQAALDPLQSSKHQAKQQDNGAAMTSAGPAATLDLGSSSNSTTPVTYSRPS